MPERLALKRLTASDLTLFEGPFHSLNAGNQKAINLNRDVLVDALYPALPLHAVAVGNEVPVAVKLYAPGGTAVHAVARKIIKHSAYKNWRLNGEFIRGPDWNPALYDSLQPGVIAVMSFHGDPLPTGLEIVLISPAQADEALLHARLSELLDSKSMRAVTPDQLSMAVADASVPAAHPVRLLALDPRLITDLEDAAQGGLRGQQKLQSRLGAGKLSPGALAKARQAAEATGREGEQLIDAYLSGHANPGGHWSHVWVAATNAISPYDFQCTSRGGEMGDQDFKIDVKSTKGSFDNDIHISLGEIVEAASGSTPYILFRVYEMNEEGGKLRRSGDIREFSVNLLASHNSAMPGQVKADSFSVPVQTSGLVWSEEITVPSASGEEDGG